MRLVRDLKPATAQRDLAIEVRSENGPLFQAALAFAINRAMGWSHESWPIAPGDATTLAMADKEPPRKPIPPRDRERAEDARQAAQEYADDQPGHH